MAERAPFRFVILGGGTAGWMAAALLVRAFGESAEIVVVESPEIGIVGVGEGSTPQLQAFFRTLGLAEEAWMPVANATYKTGISFIGWSDDPAFASYFHPFPSPIDTHTQPAYFLNGRARRAGFAVEARPDAYFLAAALARKKLAPLPAYYFPFEVAYGYHFDAHRIGAVLRAYAEERGARRIEAMVDSAALSERGDISALNFSGGGALPGDFFIDASGFRAVLIEGALRSSFVSFNNNLFNDSAVVAPTPANPQATPCETRAIAMRCGWRWDIPLTNRHGNGYVYSSRYCSHDEAEAEFRASLNLPDSVATRRLSMRVGRRAQHWAGNCLAVGLSQGFIEPLEATALHLVQSTLELFIGYFKADGMTPKRRDAFNAEVNERFEGIRDYIVCHYRMSRRSDTQYWRDAGAVPVSASLDGVLGAWFAGKDLREEVRAQGIERYYSAMSWQAMLAGYGCFPEAKRAPAQDETKVDMAVIGDFIARAALNFPDHRAVLDARGAAL
jgi:hypothetical protein